MPERVSHPRPKLEEWAEIIATGSDDARKEDADNEQEILGDFINGGAVTWRAVASTPSLDAIGRFSIFSAVPIYRLDGVEIARPG